jgi:hypothetical protein
MKSVSPALDPTLGIATTTEHYPEYEAFRRLLPELLQTHHGLYVCIYQGQMIDADTDHLTLTLRVRQHIKQEPIHIEKVIKTPHKERLRCHQLLVG